MEFLSLFQKFNFFDVLCIIIIFFSFFLAIKNGFIRSTLNSIKWLFIIYIIKNSFSLLRPFLDNYIQSQTFADIVIFISVVIISYVFLTILVKVLESLIQPRIYGLVGISLSALMGLIRAYIILSLTIIFINSSVSIDYISSLMDESELIYLFNMGIFLIGDIPNRLNQIS